MDRRSGQVLTWPSATPQNASNTTASAETYGRSPPLRKVGGHHRSRGYSSWPEGRQRVERDGRDRWPMANGGEVFGHRAIMPSAIGHRHGHPPISAGARGIAVRHAVFWEAISTPGNRGPQRWPQSSYSGSCSPSRAAPVVAQDRDTKVRNDRAIRGIEGLDLQRPERGDPGRQGVGQAAVRRLPLHPVRGVPGVRRRRRPPRPDHPRPAGRVRLRPDRPGQHDRPDPLPVRLRPVVRRLPDEPRPDDLRPVRRPAPTGPRTRTSRSKGLRKAMAEALRMHENVRADQAVAGGQAGQAGRGSRRRWTIPAWRASTRAKLDYDGNVAKSCMHCHQIREAERQVYRSAGEPIPDEVLYPYPDPGCSG